MPHRVALLALSLLTAGAQFQDPSHETRTPDVPGLTAATSTCGVSDVATFGSRENPVRVGGGVMYLASREIKYLSALRGPAGQGLHFKRLGTTDLPDGTVIDIYMVEYAGLDKAMRVHIDGYHWVQPVAPQGLLCGAEMDLNPPGPDPFETQNQLERMAVRLADRLVVPISADADGSKTHGVVFDHLRMVSLAARAAAAKGKTLDEREPAKNVRAGTVVVAFPRTCDGQEVVADAIALADSQGHQPRLLDTAKGKRVAEMVPGFEAPPNSIGFQFDVSVLIEGSLIAIRYEKACGAEGREIQLPVRFARARVTKSAQGIAPPDAQLPPEGAQMRVQVILDADGVPNYPAYVSGPWELRDAAINASAEWRLDAPTLNGAPLLQTLTLNIVVRQQR